MKALAGGQCQCTHQIIFRWSRGKNSRGAKCSGAVQLCGAAARCSVPRVCGAADLFILVQLTCHQATTTTSTRGNILNGGTADNTYCRLPPATRHCDLATSVPAVVTTTLLFQVMVAWSACCWVCLGGWRGDVSPFAWLLFVECLLGATTNLSRVVSRSSVKSPLYCFSQQSAGQTET